MISRFVLFGAIVLGWASISSSAYSADPKSFGGMFSGELKPDGCRPGPPYMISGSIKDGRTKMSTMKGGRLDMAVSENGTFEGETFLRSHSRGDKMQAYKGKIDGGKVVIDAWFGVHGFAQTQCSAYGEFPLKK